MTEIFIENKRLNISEGLSTQLNYAIDDIKDIGYKNTSFSKTIVLPGTANNNIQFGHIFDVRVSNLYNPALDNVGYNFNPSKQADCIILKDHIQVFKGVLQLVKIIIVDNVPEYECVVFGELGGLANSLGASKLQDLDFSDYDRAWNASGITASWGAEKGVGPYFPLIDYGNVSAAKLDYDLRAFRPALYVKEYLDKMFTAAGYTYSSDIINSARFKSLVIPHNQKELTKNEDVWIDAEKLDLGDYDIIDSVTPANNAAYLFTGVVTPINFIATGTGGYDTFEYTGTTGITGRIVLYIHGDLTNDGAIIQYQIRQNGTPLVTGTLDDTGGLTIDYEIIEEVACTFTNGDVFDVWFDASGGGTFNVGSDVGNMQIISDIPTTTILAHQGVIQMNDTIPRNVLQKDFLSSILKLFNLYVYEDNFKEKFLYIKPYVDFYDLNVSGVVDWTYKMDRAKAIELTPMSELNSRFYNFKFKQDSDYYNELYRNRYGEGYGDYLFDSEFAFSGDSTDVDLVFSASPLVGYSGKDKIVSAFYKLNNGLEERRDVNIRILQTKTITGVTSWAIKDDLTTLQSGLTTYGYAGHYDDPDAPANDIHFGVPNELFFTLLSGSINVQQFNLYWSAYMAEITDKDSKLLSAYFKLTNKDIFNLDFSKLIHIDGTYYRLNKVIDWDGDVCKCELLNVVNLVY